MRAYQVFAAMSPEHATQLFATLSEKAPATFAQALHAGAAAMKARPVYLQRQPFDKRAQAIRRGLSRVAANELAEELLAVYFLECRRNLLVEWLDAIGLEHEDGTLTGADPPQPDEAGLRKAVERFGRADGDPDRTLLLRAFAAQAAIEWPALDALLDETGDR